VSTLFDLGGATALITGAAQGIGLAIARGLGQAGAALILNDRNQEGLGKAVAALAAEGLQARGCAFDVSDATQIRRSIPAVEETAGPIDILVNNAGIQRRGPLEVLDESAWREVLDTNLTAAFLVSRQVVGGMIARRAGKIINIASIMGQRGRATIAPYMASKGGLIMLTKAMATEWAKHNIQVNCIGPGFMTTELNRPLMADADFDAWVRSCTPAGRWGEPSDLIGAAVFLASRASDFVNGQTLFVDGGTLAAL
jgi:gluconate 5-dehydrogenase